MPEKRQALIDEILGDARRQAERKLHHAEQEAAQILAAAKAKAEAIDRDTRDGARKKLEHETSLILATVPHEKQIRTLRIREELIAKLFDDAIGSLKSGGAVDLLDVLVRLAVQAIEQTKGTRFAIELGPDDAQRLGAQVAQKTTERLRSTGRTVQVEVVPSQNLTDGGVIVRSTDGREMIDNSFATRLRRRRQTLRGQVAAILFGDTQSE